MDCHLLSSETAKQHSMASLLCIYFFIHLSSSQRTTHSCQHLVHVGGSNKDRAYQNGSTKRLVKLPRSPSSPSFPTWRSEPQHGWPACQDWCDFDGERYTCLFACCNFHHIVYQRLLRDFSPQKRRKVRKSVMFAAQWNLRISNPPNRILRGKLWCRSATKDLTGVRNADSRSCGLANLHYGIHYSRHHKTPSNPPRRCWMNGRVNLSPLDMAKTNPSQVWPHIYYSPLLRLSDAPLLWPCRVEHALGSRPSPKHKRYILIPQRLIKFSLSNFPNQIFLI